MPPAPVPDLRKVRRGQHPPGPTEEFRDGLDADSLYRQGRAQWRDGVVSLLRLPRSAVRSQPSGRKAPSRSIVTATRETLALVLDEDAPLLDSDRDIDDVILRLRGHLMELGHAATGRPRPELDAALTAARRVADADVPTQYLDARKHLRTLTIAVETVITKLAAVGLVCGHSVECPSATARDCEAAKIRVHRPEIGCSELCNGVLIFDTGCLLPSGDAFGPRRPLPREAVTR